MKKEDLRPAEEGSLQAEKEEPIHARLALGIRDRGLAEQYAAALSQRGFKVVKAASRGVSFEGAPELFERTFESKIKVEVEEPPSFVERPKLPAELQKSVDSIYFPTRPTFFGKERKS